MNEWLIQELNDDTTFWGRVTKTIAEKLEELEAEGWEIVTIAPYGRDLPHFCVVAKRATAGKGR